MSFRPAEFRVNELPILHHKTNVSEIMWNANLMQEVNFIDVFLARHISTQWLSRPPLNHKLGAENHMLQLKI